MLTVVDSCFMSRREIPADEYSFPRALGSGTARARGRQRKTSEASSGWLESLTRAATRGEAAFVAALAPVSPGFVTAVDYERAIRLALEAGAFKAAQQMVQEAAPRYPGHLPLKRLAEVLRPGRARVVPARGPVDMSQGEAWLKRDGARYRGQWVALRAGELVANAGSYRELLSTVRAIQDPNVYVLKVR